MQHVYPQNHDNSSQPLSVRRLLRPLTRVVLLALPCMLLGCGGDGGSEESFDPGPDRTTRTFVGAANTETVEALPFAFADGVVFHADLSGEAVTLTLDTVTETVITTTLSTADNLARGEIILDLDACDGASGFLDPGCLYPVTITASDFAAGTGPQIGELLILEDWRLTAREFTQAGRVTVSLTVEDNAGTASASEQLEVDKGQLCPWVCA